MVNISSNSAQGNINITTDTISGNIFTQTPNTNSNIETQNNQAEYWSEKSKIYANNSLQNSENSSVWAEGTDAQVQALGGVHSAKTWANDIAGANKDLSNLSSTGETRFSAKQDKLTAGTDIDITNNTISFTGTIPTKISDLQDDTATNPIDKANTLTDLTATITELNHTDGVTSNIQTQLDSKISGITSSDVTTALAYTPANISASNFDVTGKSTLAGLGMPSSTYTDLTLGASGTAYTAPANGWFALQGIDDSTTAMKACVMRNSTRYFGVTNYETGFSSAWLCSILPVKKGDKVYIYIYNITSSTHKLRFYYAKGEV